MKEDSRIAWGVSLLVFGFLYLLKKIGIFPIQAEEFIFDFRNIPVVLGIIFLFFHQNKPIGIVLLSAGILLYMKNLITLAQQLSDIIWPLLLIGAGVILIVSNRTKAKKTDESETPNETTTHVQSDDEIDS